MNYTAKKPKRYEVWYCSDFENKSETDRNVIAGFRPVIVVSPDSLNQTSETLIVVPLTKGEHNYAYRVPVAFQEKNGFALCDQLFSTDKSSLEKYLGNLDSATCSKISIVLQNMFK